MTPSQSPTAALVAEHVTVTFVLAMCRSSNAYDAPCNWAVRSESHVDVLGAASYHALVTGHEVALSGTADAVIGGAGPVPGHRGEG